MGLNIGKSLESKRNSSFKPISNKSKYLASSLLAFKVEYPAPPWFL